jgi:hypothetical protein
MMEREPYWKLFKRAVVPSYSTSDYMVCSNTRPRSIYLGQLSDRWSLHLRAGNLGVGTDAEEITEARWQDKIDRAIEERFQMLASAKVRSKPDRGKSDADDSMKHAGEL